MVLEQVGFSKPQMWFSTALDESVSDHRFGIANTKSSDWWFKSPKYA
jgi:hypothetical protein